MATPTASSLTTQADCLNCIPPAMQLPVLIYIFAKLANMSTNASTLVAQAACLNCIPPAMQLPVLISLAANYFASASGGAGTVSGIVFGNYGGNQPNYTPASGVGYAVDTSGPRPWIYCNGKWQ